MFSKQLTSTYVSAGCYVKLGDILDISYFGQTFSFTIDGIEQKQSNKKLFTTESKLRNISLEKSFNNLDIKDHENTDDSESSYSRENGVRYMSNTSTPVRNHEMDKKDPHSGLSIEDTDVEGLCTSQSSVNTSICDDNQLNMPLNVTPVKGSSNVASPARTPNYEIVSSQNSYFCTPEGIKGSSSTCSNTTASPSCSGDLSSKFYKITLLTKFSIRSPESLGEVTQQNSQAVTYDDLGGLTKQIETMKEFIHLPLHSPEVFKEYGMLFL